MPLDEAGGIALDEAQQNKIVEEVNAARADMDRESIDYMHAWFAQIENAIYSAAPIIRREALCGDDAVHPLLTRLFHAADSLRREVAAVRGVKVPMSTMMPDGSIYEISEQRRVWEARK